MHQGLRERKKEQTRRLLADTALELMVRDGYAATTMAAIADAADVSRRTVFRYFADKEEVVFADDGAHTEAILAAVDSAAGDLAPLDVVRAAGHGVARVLERGPDELARWMALVAQEPALQARYLAKQRRWEALIGERLAARPGVDERAARLAAKVGIACVQSAFDAWQADPSVPLSRRIDEAFAALGALVG